MISKKNLISIVITYFKKKQYVTQTLNSILNQSYKNYEIIMIYDDSDRSDLNFIKHLLNKFKNKRLIINKKNLGVAKSRNLAIKYCRGEYLAFVDSDDIWKKKKLSYQFNYMKKNSLLFSFTSYDVIDKNNSIIQKRIVSSNPTYQSLSQSNFIGLSTVMIHKKIFSQIIFPNLKTQEDLGLWLKLLRNGIYFNYIKKSLSSWRRLENSLSSSIYQKVYDAFKLFFIYEKKNFIISLFSVLVLSYNKIIKNFD